MFSAVSATLGKYEQQIRSAAARADGSEDSSRQMSAAGDKLISLAEDGPFEHLSDDFLEGMKDDLEVGHLLQQASDSLEDSQRQDSIEKIKRRIEELKERLKYATPQQAKALLRELKQIGKEFKTASQSLNGSGQNAGSAGTLTTTTQTAALEKTETLATQSTEAVFSATSGAYDSGNLEAAIEGLLGYDLGAEELAALDAGFDTLDRISERRAEARTDAAGKDDTKGNADDGSSPSLAALVDVKEVIAAYTSTSTSFYQQSSTRTGYDGSAIKHAQYDELRDIGKQLEGLADQIEALMKRNDEETRKELEKAQSEIAKGTEALDKFQSHPSPGSEAASTSTVTTVHTEQTVAVYSSLSIEVSIPTELVA